MDSSVTPKQALEAVKAAGLDPDRPLSEQLAHSSTVDEQTVKGWAQEAVAEAAAAEPPDPERAFAELFRAKLAESTSRW